MSGVRASPSVQNLSEMKIFKSIKTYIKESYDELVHKVSWPTRAEVANSAVIVLTASLIIALVVFGMDSFFQAVLEKIYPN